MSRFVQSGTADAPIERDEAWLKAQREIESKRKAKEDIGRQADGKSLYETLQANKAAKEDAFQESARLKNQFRSLDDDEIGYLDTLLESTRAKEEAVRKETSDELERFKAQREERERVERELITNADGTAASTEAVVESEWKVGNKRRKKNIGGLAKIRRTSSAAGGNDGAQGTSQGEGDRSAEQKVPEPRSGDAIIDAATHVKPSDAKPTITNGNPVAIAKPKGALGLADYSSDEG